MAAQGLDAAKPAKRMVYARALMEEFTGDMSAFVRGFNPECTIYYNSGGIAPGYHAHLGAFSHLEFDVLPSASSGGYIAFPVRARFDRTLGLECMGMTGKFHRGWGDVHTLKNQPALEYECFQLLALNCKCSIGDQMHPRGVLEPQTYDLIGRVYSQVAAKEPWCAGAEPLCDLGVLSTEEFAGGRNSMVGAVRLLTECGQQFNILDTASDFTAYRALLLPDRIPVDAGLRAKLQAYAAAGGTLIASFESGLTPRQDGFALPELGVSLRGDGPLAPDGRLARAARLFPTDWGIEEFSDYCEVDYADYLRPRPALAQGLEPIEYAMYTKGVEVLAGADSEVLADVILPYYYRTWQHFCSHQQAPSSGQVDAPGIVKHGNHLYFSHAIFELYADFAPRWIKQAFRNALDMVLPRPLLRFSGPSALEALLNSQPAQRRWVLHLLYYLPERRANKMEIIEDVLPVEQLHLSIRKDHPVTAVHLVPAGQALPFTEVDGRIDFTLPRLCGHQMIDITWE